MTSLYTKPQTAREAATRFIEDGYAPLPLPHGSKDPSRREWQQERIGPDDVPRVFHDKQNVGLLCGEPSGGLLDVDCDAPEAIQAARTLLPPTAMRHGRGSKPDSHYWYRAASPLPTTTRYRDVDGATLVEMRSTGVQTVVPPSVHPTGELLEWGSYGEPTRVDAATLRRSVAEVAAVALVARHWPTGSRHDATLALAGALLRRGYRLDAATGIVEAICLIAGDEESASRLRDVTDTAERLASGQAATGIPALKRLLGDEVASRLCEWLDLSATRDSAAYTPADNPWPDPLAEAAYYGLAGEIVRALEPHTEADPAAILAQLLVLFGNCVGRSPYFKVEDDEHHTNLFVVTVGETSGGRKGVALNRARQPFKAVDEAWEAARVKGGLSSAEGLIWQCHDAIYKWETDKETKSLKEVMVDPGVLDKRFCATETEFASVLRQRERDGNNLSSLLRDAFDRGTLESLTKNSPARATEAHISAIGHITKNELLRYLDSTEAANGFGNRFMWLCVRRSKSLPDGGGVVDLSKQIARLTEAVAFARQQGRIERDDEARTLWRIVYGPLTEGRPGMLGAMIARAAPIVVRLSVIYALLDCSPVIRVPHLRAAVALWDYAEASARWIFADTLGDAVADEILRALRAAPSGLTRTDVYAGLFGRNQSAARLGRALALLLEQGLVRCEREETGGRPSERWFAAQPSSR